MTAACSRSVFDAPDVHGQRVEGGQVAAPQIGPRELRVVHHGPGQIHPDDGGSFQPGGREVGLPHPHPLEDGLAQIGPGQPDVGPVPTGHLEEAERGLLEETPDELAAGRALD